jgi:hypothetical protein
MLLLPPAAAMFIKLIFNIRFTVMSSERAFHYNFHFLKFVLLWKESYILLVNIEHTWLLPSSLRLRVSGWVWYFSWWSLPPSVLFLTTSANICVNFLCVISTDKNGQYPSWHHFWECTFHPCVPFLQPNYKNGNKHCCSFGHGCFRADKILTVVSVYKFSRLFALTAWFAD